jgi:di/tripeptidase
MGAPAEGIHTTAEKIHLPSLYKRLEWLIAVIYALVK